MKTTTLRATAVALAAGLLCWHQASHAAATESQLRSITLYGNVSIQEDSTQSWGPWAEFEPPAAGNTQPVAAPRIASDPYRPLAQPLAGNPTTPPVAPPCASGGICGFGIFGAGDPNDLASLEYLETWPEINAIRLNGTVVQAGESEGSASLLPQVIRLDTTVLSATDIAFQRADSGNLSFTSGEGGYKYARPFSQYIDEYDIRPDGTRGGEHDPQSTQVIHFNLATYVAGNASQNVGWGVIGYTTSAAQMEALRGVTEATYSGTDHYGANVNLRVYFNEGRWDGSWNGGGDTGTVGTKTTASGGTLLTTGVGFSVNNRAGTINGSTFSANQFSSNDGGTVSGNIQGAFFGPNAAAAGGVVDITKSRPPLQNGNATPANVSPTQGYTNGRYVAPFLTVKQPTGQGS